jgi:glucose/arabinose dehydrogenase
VRAFELPPNAARQQDALIGSDLDPSLLFNRLPILARTAEEDREHPVQHGDIFRSALFPVSPVPPHCPQVPFFDFEILAPPQIAGGYERSHHPAGVCIVEPVPDISGIEQHETMIVLVDSSRQGANLYCDKELRCTDLQRYFEEIMRSSPALLLLAAMSTASPAAEAVSTEQARFVVTTLAEGLDHPWGIVVLPDGVMLVTERPGTLRHVDRNGKLGEPIVGVPEVDARDQGGLLDITLHPKFSENRLLYFSFSEKGDGGNSTAVARAKLSEDNSKLSDVQIIFSQMPKVDSTMHFGSRIVFDRSGRIFVGLGERSEERFRSQAQDLGSHLGKVIRINDDGTVPEDNPFLNRTDVLPEIWSYGHRNIQAAALHPDTGKFWEIEHGPKGGDEVNIPEAGKNYGWPVVSHGVNYDGTPVGKGKKQASGMEDPLYTWTPVIAPSGMLFYSGKAFPEWKGDLFVGGLSAQSLVRLELEGENVVAEERLLEDLGQRIRDVVEGPQGEIIVITDHDNGQIIKIAPAD